MKLELFERLRQMHAFKNVMDRRFSMRKECRIVLFFICLIVASQEAKSQNSPLSSNPMASELPRTLYTADAEIVDRFSISDAVNVEVFWCDGSPEANLNQISALELASSIATYARFSNPNNSSAFVPDAFIKSVRLKPLTQSERLEVSVRGNVMILPEGNDHIRHLSEVMTSFSGQKLETVMAGQLPNNVKISICSESSFKRVPSRIFTQISRKEQELAARDAIRKINAEVKFSAALNQIEIVGSRAPAESEVRYFYSEDESTARQILTIVAEASRGRANLKFLSSLASKASLGTIEVWFGSGIETGSRSTFLLCQGEFQAKCPPGSEFVPCGDSIEYYLSRRQACSRFEQRRLTAAGGNRCGYALSEISCFSSPP